VDADHPFDVSIIIVSYNTIELTRAAIASVAAETLSARYEIIVVDNASSDGSPAMLELHPARPRIIQLYENIGFARANNLAARSARGQYILLLNPDTVVLDRAIDRLLDFAEQNPAARIWGGRTVYADGTLNPSSCWARMTPWNLLCRATGLTGIFPDSALFNGEAFGGWRRDTPRTVDIVSGCFLLIEAELWRRLGGLDERFFMYGEEADLCLRAAATDAAPIVTPTATIVHYGGASERVRTDKLVRLLTAKTTLIRRHWHPALQPLGVALLLAWPLTRAIASLVGARWMQETGAATDNAAAWREVWSRRREWGRGYAQREESPAMADGWIPPAPQRSAA
jgi:GT2 family glycosyltransferase